MTLFTETLSIAKIEEMLEQFPKRITQETSFTFSISQSGIYGITITARCQTDEDLRVEIDNLKLREIPEAQKPQYHNISPSWNGAELKGLTKIVIFILKLNKGEHTLKFTPIKSGVIDEYKIEKILDLQKIQFNLGIQAEDGDRRPWLTFALIDLPLELLSADVSVKWHFLDGDDIKLIVDGQIKQNPKSILHKNWVWTASILKKFFGKEREEKTFTENLNPEIHYIEFWADKTPTIHKVELDLGKISSKSIPTADNPKWTGDFNDDTDQMILARAIFGEARSNNYSDKARVAVGWSIRNRVDDSRWADNYHDVITQKDHYSAFNLSDDNRPYVENPFWRNNDIDKRAWYNCFEIAGKVISGKVKDPTNGANHYYDSSIPTPYWATQKTLVLTIKSLDNKRAIFFHNL